MIYKIIYLNDQQIFPLISSDGKCQQNIYIKDTELKMSKEEFKRKYFKLSNYSFEFKL